MHTHNIYIYIYILEDPLCEVAGLGTKSDDAEVQDEE